jgi:1-phosphofructokinase family hexose kinase
MTKPMILTACPNTALDKVYFIKKWTPGRPMRTNKTITSVGGKGLDSSVVLRQLGVSTTAIGFFAGSVGQELVTLLAEYSIISVPIWVGGTTRTAHVIAEEEPNIHTHIIVGEIEINNDQKQVFLKKFSENLTNADWVILAGSVPPSINDDFYADLIKLAKKQNVPVLIDSQKAYIIKAIAAEPAVAKMNWEEFEWTFNKPSDSIETLYENAKYIRSEYRIKNMVLTLSKEGILALTTEGDYLAKAPLQIPVNAAGAGDAVSSTLVWRLYLGESWKESLRWASAVSAAAVLTKRTGDVNMQDVYRILPEVVVQEL